MTKPFGPVRLSLRAFLLATISASMALSACLSMKEKRQRELTIERIQSEARARLEDQHQKEQREKREAEAAEQSALEDWKEKNELYIRALCASSPGAEHQYAWDNYRVAVSTDTERAREAEKLRRPVFACEEFRIHKSAIHDAGVQP